MPDNSYKRAERLAAHLQEALRALAKRGSADPSDLIFEAPETLHALKSFGLDGGDLSPEERVANAIESAVGELPSTDKDAAEIILGLAPSTRGRRLGARREQAAEILGVTAGTFRNRQEARLLGDLAKRMTAILLSATTGPAITARGLQAGSEKAFGFWSYVQGDDAGDGGRVLALSTDLRTQYGMRTAEELELFVDRESARWGEEWEELISDAIAGTTFFIPIITPSYFRSNSCRQELLKFVREADRAGLQRLLMPVYWITVPALESEGVDSIDEAIRAVARHQWRDLRDVRLEDQTSSLYRKAVSGLAGDIAERASEVAELIDDLPANGHSVVDRPVGSEDDDAGLLERLAEGDEAMEVITGVMTGIGEDIELIGGMASSAAEQMQATQGQHQGMKRALAISERFAQELDVPASRIEESGKRYVDLLVRLDSGIQARFDVFEEQSEPLTEEQVKYLAELEDLARNADGALDSLEELVNSVDPIVKISRSLRAPVRKMRSGLQGILDGRAVISEWGRRAGELQIHAGSDTAESS